MTCIHRESRKPAIYLGLTIFFFIVMWVVLYGVLTTGDTSGNGFVYISGFLSVFFIFLFRLEAVN